MIIVLSFVSCSNNKNRPNIKLENDRASLIKAEAESYLESNIKIAIEDDIASYIKTSNPGWVALEINIPVAGRYQIILRAANKTNEIVECWLEDYTDNLDGRTINISSKIQITNHMDQFNDFKKDGIPLYKGLHKMKIHFNGPVAIDFIEFKLLKSHQNTSHILVQRTDGKKWIKVWEDEFNNDFIDTKKWTFDIGDWGWGNNELQYYTKKKLENARLDNGHLIIEARKNKTTGKWTSTRITTREKTSFLYGRFEIKAKIPSGKGTWAAAWLLGDEYFDELSWPQCGEIGIFESLGYEINDVSGKGIVHASVHNMKFNSKFGKKLTSSTSIDSINSKFHIYKVDWTPHQISFYVDEYEYLKIRKKNIEVWPYNKPHNIVLNLAMGGDWAGKFGVDENISSQQLIIDYVRVYEKR